MLPAEKLEQIDSLNLKIYNSINNGVYQSGFSKNQQFYNKLQNEMFGLFDQIETMLTKQRYLLTNDLPTEVDWRLWPTIVRFDAVYYFHFKCNKKRISDYPNISNYLRDLYQTYQMDKTVDFDEIKLHYYFSHESVNPNRIVPKGGTPNL